MTELEGKFREVQQELLEDRNRQCGMKMKAREQRDAITKGYKILKESLETVKAVLESDDPAIVDTIWVPDLGISETLYDNVCAALERAQDVIRASKQGGDL